MSSDDIPSAKNPSPFLSLFSRKKRKNRDMTKSSDDIKVTPTDAQFLHNSNGQGTANGISTNGCIDSENSGSLKVPLEPASTSWAQEPQLPQTQSQSQQRQPEVRGVDFTDRIRYHKNSRKHKRTGTSEGADDQLLPHSGIQPNARSRSETRTTTGKSPVLMIPKKAYSVDAVNSDPGYLMEALETLADEQPRVARSIPKHAIVDTSNFAARSLDNCLFDAEVYDAMLYDSIKVCEMLQNHLSQCIATVRAKSPDGQLEALTEESDENMETTTFSQERQRRSTERNRRSVTITSSTLTSSTDDGTFDYPVETSSKLKPKVQFKDC